MVVKVSKNKMAFMASQQLVKWLRSLYLMPHNSNNVNNLGYLEYKKRPDRMEEYLQGLVRLLSTTFLLNKRTY
jgi:hypothetical protein